MRFIATADWQLGMTAHFLDDEARARFHQARLDTVAEIGRIAAQRDAGFVVVGGDVFESNQLDRSILLRAFEALRACPVPVLLVPGNHDPLDASSSRGARSPSNWCPESRWWQPPGFRNAQRLISWRRPAPALNLLPRA